MFYKKDITLFLFVLLGWQTAILCSYRSKIFSLSYAVTLFAVGSVSLVTYKYGPLIIEAVQNKMNDYIETEIADDLVLMLTPNGTINNFPEVEREKKFRKKAHLINGRIRILKKLEAVVVASNNGLSEEHKKNVSNALSKAQLFFNSVDVLRSVPILFKENPYQKEYKSPTIIDQFIENRIVDAIIDSSKPEAESNENENNERTKIELSTKRILQKIAKDIGEVAYKGITYYIPFMAKN